MDRWKSRGGKSQRREERKKKNQRRERGRRQKMQVREKVAKSRNTVSFQRFVAPEGRKVGLLKWRVRSHLARREMKNCRPLWREAHFQVKMLKAPHARTTFAGLDVVLCGRRKGLCTLSTKREGFVAFPNMMAGVGHLPEDLQRCIFCGRRSTRDMFIRDVRRSGRWFPEHGCILEHQVFRFPKMILRDRCSTSYDLASKFRGRCSTLDRWQIEWKNCKTHWHEALSSALKLSIFWRKSRRTASFLMLSTSKSEEASQFFSFLTLSSSKIEEVSQNCCVLMLSSSRRIEEVSQHSFVFKLADRWDGWMRWMDGWMDEGR